MKSKLTGLFVVLFLTLFSKIEAQNIIGYAPYYRDYNADFDFSKYTHIHYFAIWPAADGSFIFAQIDSSDMAKQYKKMAKSAHLKGVKMVMTFGGMGKTGSKYFIEMASDPTSRATFIANVIALCKTWDIDGVDIDWEWNKHDETQVSRDAYTNLMREIRVATTANNLSLSTAVAGGAWMGVNYNPEAVRLADYVNLMSYCYNGEWATTTKHHAGLNSTINVGINYWLGLGIIKAKLNIGVPFYAFSYKGTTELSTSFTSVEEIKYKEVKELISSGYTVVEDDEKGTYCYSKSNNEIVFYDSPANVAHKTKYAINNNFGGIAIWEIGQDHNQDLSTAIKNAK